MFERDLVGFQSLPSISFADRLSVVELYLKFTVIEFNGVGDVQITGACIGSSVARILAIVFLYDLGEKIEHFLETLRNGVTFVRRHVDAIIVCSRKPQNTFNVRDFTVPSVLGCMF